MHESIKLHMLIGCHVMALYTYTWCYLNQVKQIYLLKHLPFFYGENLQSCYFNLSFYFGFSVLSCSLG
jgi:hypothetical protein